MSRSKPWKVVLLTGVAIYVIGVVTGVVAERYGHSNALIDVFLAGITLGAIASLVAYVGLGLTASAGSLIAGGLISLFLALFIPMTFEHFGVSPNVHGSAGIASMLFAATTGLGGLLSLAIGLVRMASSPA